MNHKLIKKKIINGTIYKSVRYKNWRKKVFQRDNFRCRWCKAVKGTYIQAHHIKPKYKFPDLIYTVRNGVTLCLPCHKKVTGSELKYVSFFRKMLKETIVKSKYRKKNRHIKRILKWDLVDNYEWVLELLVHQ